MPIVAGRHKVCHVRPRNPFGVCPVVVIRLILTRRMFTVATAYSRTEPSVENGGRADV